MNDTALEGGTTSERLLSAAIKAFGAKGFHGTTTRDIANSAGMSPAGVYVHFASKEKLLFLIMETGHRGVLAAIKAAAAPATNPVDQLAAIVHAFALWHAEWHVRARVVNYELNSLDPNHHATILRLRKQITCVVTEVVESGRADGSFDVSDVQLTAGSLLSLGIDLSRWYDEAGSITPARVADHHVELALRMVGADRARTVLGAEGE